MPPALLSWAKPCRKELRNFSSSLTASIPTHAMPCAGKAWPLPLFQETFFVLVCMFALLLTQ
jgi:hypothetical protein